jgi:hypothetical protein
MASNLKSSGTNLIGTNYWIADTENGKLLFVPLLTGMAFPSGLENWKWTLSNNFFVANREEGKLFFLPNSSSDSDETAPPKALSTWEWKVVEGSENIFNLFRFRTNLLDLLCSPYKTEPPIGYDEFEYRLALQEIQDIKQQIKEKPTVIQDRLEMAIKASKEPKNSQEIEYIVFRYLDCLAKVHMDEVLKKDIINACISFYLPYFASGLKKHAVSPTYSAAEFHVTCACLIDMKKRANQYNMPEGEFREKLLSYHFTEEAGVQFKADRISQELFYFLADFVHLPDREGIIKAIPTKLREKSRELREFFGKLYIQGRFFMVGAICQEHALAKLIEITAIIYGDEKDAKELCVENLFPFFQNTSDTAFLPPDSFLERACNILLKGDPQKEVCSQAVASFWQARIDANSSYHYRACLYSKSETTEEWYTFGMKNLEYLEEIYKRGLRHFLDQTAVNKEINALKRNWEEFIHGCVPSSSFAQKKENRPQKKERQNSGSASKKKARASSSVSSAQPAYRKILKREEGQAATPWMTNIPEDKSHPPAPSQTPSWASVVASNRPVSKPAPKPVPKKTEESPSQVTLRQPTQRVASARNAPSQVKTTQVQPRDKGKEKVSHAEKTEKKGKHAIVASKARQSQVTLHSIEGTLSKKIEYLEASSIPDIQECISTGHKLFESEEDERSVEMLARRYLSLFFGGKKTLSHFNPKEKYALFLAICKLLIKLPSLQADYLFFFLNELKKGDVPATHNTISAFFVQVCYLLQNTGDIYINAAQIEEAIFPLVNELANADQEKTSLQEAKKYFSQMLDFLDSKRGGKYFIFRLTRVAGETLGTYSPSRVRIFAKEAFKEVLSNELKGKHMRHCFELLEWLLEAEAFTDADGSLAEKLAERLKKAASGNPTEVIHILEALYRKEAHLPRSFFAPIISVLPDVLKAAGKQDTERACQLLHKASKDLEPSLLNGLLQILFVQALRRKKIEAFSFLEKHYQELLKDLSWLLGNQGHTLIHPWQAIAFILDYYKREKDQDAYRSISHAILIAFELPAAQADPQLKEWEKYGKEKVWPLISGILRETNPDTQVRQGVLKLLLFLTQKIDQGGSSKKSQKEQAAVSLIKSLPYDHKKQLLAFASSPVLAEKAGSCKELTQLCHILIAIAGLKGLSVSVVESTAVLYRKFVELTEQEIDGDPVSILELYSVLRQLLENRPFWEFLKTNNTLFLQCFVRHTKGLLNLARQGCLPQAVVHEAWERIQKENTGIFIKNDVVREEFSQLARQWLTFLANHESADSPSEAFKLMLFEFFEILADSSIKAAAFCNDLFKVYYNRGDAFKQRLQSMLSNLIELQDFSVDVSLQFLDNYANLLYDEAKEEIRQGKWHFYNFAYFLGVVQKSRYDEIKKRTFIIYSTFCSLVKEANQFNLTIYAINNIIYSKAFDKKEQTKLLKILFHQSTKMTHCLVLGTYMAIDGLPTELLKQLTTQEQALCKKVYDAFKTRKLTKLTYQTKEEEEFCLLIATALVHNKKITTPNTSTLYKELNEIMNSLSKVKDKYPSLKYYIEIQQLRVAQFFAATREHRTAEELDEKEKFALSLFKTREADDLVLSYELNQYFNFWIRPLFENVPEDFAEQIGERFRFAMEQQIFLDFPNELKELIQNYILFLIQSISPKESRQQKKNKFEAVKATFEKAQTILQLSNGILFNLLVQWRARTSDEHFVSIIERLAKDFMRSHYPEEEMETVWREHVNRAYLLSGTYALITTEQI